MSPPSSPYYVACSIASLLGFLFLVLRSTFWRLFMEVKQCGFRVGKLSPYTSEFLSLVKLHQTFVSRVAISDKQLGNFLFLIRIGKLFDGRSGEMSNHSRKTIFKGKHFTTELSRHIQRLKRIIKWTWHAHPLVSLMAWLLVSPLMT